ncbi:MAG: class I SAM-dependent methyltransferase [Planctomycetota bacterium]
MDAPSPRPYTGHRIERHDRLGAPWTTSSQDADVAGTRTYRFNALGFRGPDYRPDAAFKVFVFGESDAFGLGVDFEEVWTTRVARGEAKRRGFSPEETCVMNFAEGGASNASIARMVVTQCAAVRPDLVLVNFAQHRRTEAYAEGVAFPVGPWHDDRLAERTVQEARRAGGLRDRLEDQLGRARAFLRFCDEEQGLFQSARDVLLVQSTLGALELEGIAIARDPERYRDPEALSDPALGPLLRLIDEKFFALEVSPLKLVDEVDWREDGNHVGPVTHAAIAERVARCLEPRKAHRTHEGAPMDDTQAVAEITESVRSFYTDLPFNFHGTVDAAVDAIQRPTVKTQYPDLHEHLKRLAKRRTDGDGSLDISVLEVGCGAGWFSHGLAHHYAVEVDAIDLTPAALERARELAPIVGTEGRVRFRECNVFEFHSPKRYDLIVSLGVLHHTGDARRAFERVARHLAPGGRIYLGLYHGPGRRVFLDEMQRIANEEGEEAAFERYRRLDRVHADDETLARSWFRDQVLHPHETQHTLAEVCEWLDASDLDLVSTSINRFGRIGERSALFEEEQGYEGRSRRALFDENRYFPGFFTVFAARRD